MPEILNLFQTEFLNKHMKYYLVIINTVINF
jgi:hypothetical protein